MFGTSLPRWPVLVISIFLTTSVPSTTLPNTVCFPSRKGVGTVVIKNWDPLVLGPAFWDVKLTNRCYYPSPPLLKTDGVGGEAAHIPPWIRDPAGHGAG